MVQVIGTSLVYTRAQVLSLIPHALLIALLWVAPKTIKIK